MNNTMHEGPLEMHSMNATHKKSVTWESDLLVESPPIAQPSTSLSELTDTIVREIEDIVSGRTCITRKESLVFQIVCGGNVEVIRSVFKRIKDDGNKQALDWMVGTSLRTKPNIEREIKAHSNSQWIKVLLFGLVVFLFIVITPVFYVLHALAVQMCLLYRRRISKHMQLPLVYALISEDVEMVRLFLENGCRVSNIDMDGNNVYHYIADLSLDDPDKAFRCHEIIISLVKNINKLRHVITKHENNRRLTAWESMAKHGSLYLFKYIAMDQCGIGSRILSVSQEILWAKLPAEDWTQVDEQLSPGTGTDLDTKTFVQEEHEHPAIIDVWEFDLHRYNQGDVFSRHSYPLHLLTSRTVEHLTKMDATSLLTFTLLWDWMRRKIRLYVLPCVLSHVLNLGLIISLLIFTVKHGGDMHTSPLAAPAYKKHITDMHSFSEVINNQQYDPSHNSTSIREFAKMMDIRSCVLNRTNETSTVFKFGVRGEIDSCMEDVIKDLYTLCKPLKLEDIILAIFENQMVSSTPIMDANIRTYIYMFIGASLILDIIARIVFLSSNFHWKASSRVDMIWPVISRTIPGSYVEKQLGNIMFTLYLAAVLVGYKRRRSIAVIERGYQLYHSILYQQDSPQSRMELFSVAEDIKAHGAITDSLEHLWGNLVILCLLLRFIQLIYTLRLLPGIGFFIITAKKMAKHLAQFTAIFIIVSLAFATIFYLVMKNPKCPAMKLDNFRSLLTSLFTIYQVFLGYGEYEFSANVNARLAYIAYTVTTVLLLLNLVIAVMTTTVEELNRTPWKQVMCLFEVWDEILGIEAVMLTMALPIKLLMRKAKKLLQITEDAAERTRYEIVCWSRFEGAHSAL